MRTYRYKVPAPGGWVRLRAEHRPGPYGGYYLIFDDGSTPARYRQDGQLGQVQKYPNTTYNCDFWRLEAENGNTHGGFETLKAAVEMVLARLKNQRPHLV